MKELSLSYNEERNKKGKVQVEELDELYYAKIKDKFKGDWGAITSTHFKWSSAFGIALGTTSFSINENHSNASDKENEQPETEESETPQPEKINSITTKTHYPICFPLLAVL